ncbi:DUF4167 domain-containing protein [Ferrovibrio sp. MS7]|uniref:DUF4167 domain-containing protein n=1 Tax=Ferrovibrio plantarum TaxID=3119164 RepID=UPI0031354913
MNKNRQRGGRPQGRRPHGGGGGGGGNNGGMNSNNAHRNFDSNGPDVKIRGTASHIFERYCQLARDANSSGDRVQAESFLQHAEHYYRIMLAQGVAPAQRAANAANGPQQNGNGNGQPHQQQPQQQAGGAPFSEGEPQPSLEMELEQVLESAPREGQGETEAREDASQQH